MKKNKRMASAARQKRLAQAQLKARIAQIRSAADEDDTEVEEVVEETTEETEEKEARKYARKGRRILRACRKKAQELIEEEGIAEDEAEIAEIAEEVAEEAAEDVIDEVDPDAPFEEIEDDIEEAVEEVVEEVVAKHQAKARKAKAARKAKRTAAKARKVAEDADDLSDDLTGPDGDSSHIEQLHDGDGISVDTTITDEEVDEQISQEPPASATEAEDKMAAAYDLIEAQMAHGIIATNIRKAALASKYAKSYTTREMKFASKQLRSVGKAGKTANVRVTKRGGMSVTASATPTTSDMAAECLFA